jgi:5-methylcytosine-specific restriction endonuclease McrA
VRSDKHIKIYKRFGTFTLDEVLPFVIKRQHKNRRTLTKERKEYNGHSVKMVTECLNLFKEKGTKCVSCGVKGIFFALEKQYNHNSHRAQFSLYGYDSNGMEVLLTKDHIIPKAKGGKSKQSNYQVMCQKCNLEKADKMPNEKSLIGYRIMKTMNGIKTRGKWWKKNDTNLTMLNERIIIQNKHTPNYINFTIEESD